MGHRRFQGIYPCSVNYVYIKQTPRSLHRKYAEKSFRIHKSSLPNIVCALALITHCHPRGYISEETRSTLRVNVFRMKVLLGTLLLHLLLETGPPFYIVIAEKRQCLHFSVIILRLWVSAVKCSTKWANPAVVKKQNKQDPSSLLPKQSWLVCLLGGRIGGREGFLFTEMQKFTNSQQALK